MISLLTVIFYSEIPVLNLYVSSVPMAPLKSFDILAVFKFDRVGCYDCMSFFFMMQSIITQLLITSLYMLH